MLLSEKQIRSFVPGPIKKSGSHLIMTCWNCSNSNHYYFNLLNNLSDCKKCQIETNLFGFLSGWGRLDLLEGSQVNFKEDIKSLRNTTQEEQLDLNLPDCRLPVGFKKLDFNSNHELVKYLKGRKYTKDDFLTYEPGYTELLERFENYVIIPVSRDFSVKGLVCRNTVDNEQPRYQNSKGTQFGKLLDGFDSITSNTHTAIISEGHFDKVSINTELGLNSQDEWKALCSFGKKISVHQEALLRTTNIKDVFLIYDADAVSAIKNYGISLNKYFNVQGCFINNKKDPGKMNATEIMKTLQAAEPIESFFFNKVQSNRLK